MPRVAPFIIPIALTTLLLTAAARGQNTPIPSDVAAAVDRGLAALARAQDPGGSWSPTGGGQRSVAVTGLCAMAFMARGHVPGQGPYGENINRAIDFVIAQQAPNGLLGQAGFSPMYDHGIATIMLCEAYGMLDDRRQSAARTAINRSVSLIISAQRHSKDDPAYRGGWRYQPDDSTSDISVSGWQLMALRAAANAGAVLPPDAISGGVEYIRRCANDDGGFGYLKAESNGSSHARTGVGVLALILMGKEDDPAIKRGASYLIKNSSGLLNSSYHYYTLYYCAQAGWQLGGAYWTQLNADISADLRRRQKSDGTWSSETGGEGQGPNYATAMAVLALTVPYRYLPLYQR